MDLSVELWLGIAGALFGILLCWRLIFWSRKWRTKRWLDRFSHAFAELEECNLLCSEVSRRYVHGLSRDGHRNLFDVTVFVTELQVALPEWYEKLGRSRTAREIDELCDILEITLGDLSRSYDCDPIEVMIEKLRAVAHEVLVLAHEPKVANGLTMSAPSFASLRQEFADYGLVD